MPLMFPIKNAMSKRNNNNSRHMLFEIWKLAFNDIACLFGGILMSNGIISIFAMNYQHDAEYTSQSMHELVLINES